MSGVVSKTISNVLLIDDSDLFLEATTLLLKQAGVQNIDAALNGEEGLEAIRTNDYDLVFIDLVMPKMDGVELLEAMGEIKVKCPVVLLSGKDSTVLKLAQKVGANSGVTIIDAIEKPIDQQRINRILIKQINANPYKSGEPIETVRKADVISRMENNDAPLILYYQPVFDIKTSDMTGAEALIRWDDKERGILPPAAFLGAVEQTGLLSKITDWVSNRVVQDLPHLLKKYPGFKVSLNITLSDLTDTRFVGKLYDLVTSHRISPRNITLEIVETSALTTNAAISSNLAKASIKGFNIAIDDFGTGASTMQQLQELPCNIMKIDQMFVRDNKNDLRLLAMLESSINLGKSLGLEVVAEGIETAEELTVVHAFGADLGQGYYFAKPMPIEDLLNFKKTLTPAT